MTRADEIATGFQAPLNGNGRSRTDGAGAARNGAVAAPAPSDAIDELHAQETDSGAPGEVDGENTEEAGAEAAVAPLAKPSRATDDTAVDATASETVDADEIIEAPHHESLPEIARQAASVWLKAAGWTAGTSLRVGNELRKIAADPNSAQEVIEEVTREVREVARDFLGITELESEVKEMAPLLSTGLLKTGVSSPEALRAQGEQLLREAADVGFEEGAHPAFARILTELSPDEARILRLLAIEGPQPMVDVRAHNLIGNGSQLIAQSLNMLGPKAGLRQHDRVPVYLTNLVRVNLVVLSEDPLESPVRYQVLEAQPDVLAVMHDTVRAKVIRRSVLLTPLGQEFCDVCLPVNLPTLPPPGAE